MEKILVYIEPRRTTASPYPLSRLDKELSKYFTDKKMFYVNIGDEVHLIGAETIILKKKTWDTVSDQLLYWFKYSNE